MSSIGWDYLHSPQPIWSEHGFEPLTFAHVIERERLIIVSVKDETTSREIFRQIHDVVELQEWLFYALLHIFDPSPACLDQSINPLKAIDQFYETVPDEPDDEFNAWVDELYNFRKVHDIRFGFRGCNIPSVLFGSRNGQTCIWYVHNNEYIEENVIMTFQPS